MDMIAGPAVLRPANFIWQVSAERMLSAAVISGKDSRDFWNGMVSRSLLREREMSLANSILREDPDGCISLMEAFVRGKQCLHGH